MVLTFFLISIKFLIIWCIICMGLFSKRNFFCLKFPRGKREKWFRHYGFRFICTKKFLPVFVYFEGGHHFQKIWSESNEAKKSYSFMKLPGKLACPKNWNRKYSVSWDRKIFRPCFWPFSWSAWNFWSIDV